MERRKTSQRICFDKPNDPITQLPNDPMKEIPREGIL
jgi:hypothetical protein